VSEVIPELLQLRIDLSAVGAAVPLHANQALSQLGPPGADGQPDGVYLTIGAVAPPPLLDGDPEGQEKLIGQLRITGVKVNVLGQFHMSRAVLGELIAILQASAAKYDAATGLASRDKGDAQGAS